MDAGIGYIPLSTLRSAPFISFPMMHVIGIYSNNHQYSLKLLTTNY